MFRKLTLALGAIAVVAVAAASSATPASAGHGWGGPGWGGHGFNRWHRGGFGFGLYAPTYIAGGYCYTVKRVVPTYYGPRVRYVQVCN